jgi:hypothetical protein
MAYRAASRIRPSECPDPPVCDLPTLAPGPTPVRAGCRGRIHRRTPGASWSGQSTLHCVKNGTYWQGPPAFASDVTLAFPGRNPRRCGSLASFKMRAWQLGLSNDARKCAPFERIVKRNRNRNRRAFDPSLHDAVASTLADHDESVPFENPANLVRRKDAKPTQQGPQLASQRFRCGNAVQLQMGLRSRRIAKVLLLNSLWPLRSKSLGWQCRVRGTETQTHRLLAQ